MIFIHVGLNHFHDYIVAKSVNSSNALLTSKVNIVIYYVAILRVRGHPHFYAIFCRLRWHILSKRKSAFKSNHALVYGNVFVGRITSLAVF